MQIKTTRFLYTPISVAKIKKKKKYKSSVGKDMEKLDHSSIANRNVI